MSRRVSVTVSASRLARSATTPAKRAQLSPEAEGGEPPRGQVIVLFAAFLVGMIGVMGLGTDLGYAFAAQRTAQGAADAGALAGARAIAAYTPSAPTRALPEVTTLVTDNGFGGATPVVHACQYIGNNFAVVGQCGSTVPTNATGALVRTRLTVPTFFLRIFPAVPETVTVSGYAKARVQASTFSGADAPFIICGFNAWDVTSRPTTSSGGTNTNILSSASPVRINQNAVGRTFRVHDNQLHTKGNAKCSTQGSRFNGLADQGANAGKNVPNWFTYDTGTIAGPTRTKVDGAQGCDANAPTPYNCVMILPIATNNPAESGNSKQVWVVGYAAFDVTRVNSNSHNATLLDSYILSGPGTDTWCRDCGGPVVIRLVW